MSKKRIFADGMDSINLTEGLVRMDLYNAVPNPEQRENPNKEVTTELIMTPQGFVKTFTAMERLVEQLVEAGILKRSTRQQPSHTVASVQGSVPGAAAKEAGASPNISVSPNFEQ